MIYMLEETQLHLPPAEPCRVRKFASGMLKP